MKLATAFSAILLAGTFAAPAAVERYKDEALYLARLADLGYASLGEDFEGTDWHTTRSTISNPRYLTSISSKRLAWDSAADELWTYQSSALIATNTNWARGTGYGIFDNSLAST